MKHYFVYAAILDDPTTPELVVGRTTKEDHAALLKRCKLTDRFEAKPRAFLMGRAAVLGDMAVVDVGSDLFTGRTGIVDPLAALPERELAAFKHSLASHFGGREVLLILGGLRHRVPGLSARKIQRLLSGAVADIPHVILEGLAGDRNGNPRRK